MGTFISLSLVDLLHKTPVQDKSSLILFCSRQLEFYFSAAEALNSTCVTDRELACHAAYQLYPIHRWYPEHQPTGIRLLHVFCPPPSNASRDGEGRQEKNMFRFCSSSEIFIASGRNIFICAQDIHIEKWNPVLFKQSLPSPQLFKLINVKDSVHL